MAGQSEVRAGGAFVELSVRSAKFNAGLRSAAAGFKRFGSSLQSLGGNMLMMDMLKIAPLAIFAKHAADVGSALADMSDRTGMSIESLSAFQFALGQTGATLEDMETAIKKMQKASQADDAGKTFGKLGIAIDDFKKMDPHEQMVMLSEAIGTMTDPAKKTAAALEIFGKAGTKLLPLFVGGADGMQGLLEKAEDLGLVMSTKDALAAEKFGDALDTMKSIASRAMVLLGSGLIPSLQNTADGIMNCSKKVMQWISDNRGLVVSIATGAAAFIALDIAVIGLGVTISAFGIVLGAIASAFAIAAKSVLFLAANWKLLLAAIAGGSVLKALASSFASTFTKIVGDAKEAGGAIVEALGAGNLQGAWEVSAAFFKLTWARSFEWFKKQWDEISTFVQLVWNNVTATLAARMGDALSGLEGAWTKLGIFGAKIIAGWVHASAKFWKMFGFFNDNDIAVLEDEIEKMFQGAFGGKSEKELDAKRKRERDDQASVIEQDRKHNEGVILRNAGDGLKKAADDVKEAEKALKDATEKVKGAAVAKIEDAKIGDALDSGGWGKGGAAGTFSGGMARQIFGAGGGDIPKKQLKTQEDAAKTLKEIRDGINKGGFAFS
jgi:hypothetical protein